jgi:hypothetical protein
MNRNLKYADETWPHVKENMDLASPVFLVLGSGGLRFMGRLPVGRSTYLASSYTDNELRVSTKIRPIELCKAQEGARRETYGAGNGTLVGRLALHVEGDAIGSFGLDLEAR